MADKTGNGGEVFSNDLKYPPLRSSSSAAKFHPNWCLDVVYSSQPTPGQINPMHSNRSVHSVAHDKWWWTPLGFLRRWRYSRYRTLFLAVSDEGICDGISSDDVDVTVNTMSLVNALLLAIPFSCMGSFQNQSLDWFETNLSACSTWKYDIDQAMDQLQQIIVCTIYLPIGALVLACIYYVSRPSKSMIGNEENNNRPFQTWFRRGRYIILIFSVMTVGSILLSIFLAQNFFQDFFTTTAKFCSGEPKRGTIMTSGWTALLFVFLFCIYVSVKKLRK